MTKNLKTGEAEFVGSHLCERLFNEGNEVICYDNYFTGNKKNVEQLMSNNFFELIRHDITEPYYAEVDEVCNIIELTNSKSKLTHLPLPQDDPKQRQPDITLAREKLNGWGPKVQLKEGLLKTISYFDSVI